MVERFNYTDDRIHGGLDNPNSLLPETAGDSFAPHPEFPGFSREAVTGIQAAIAMEDMPDPGEALRIRREMEAIQEQDAAIREAGKSELIRFGVCASSLIESLVKAAKRDPVISIYVDEDSEVATTAVAIMRAMFDGGDIIEALGNVRMSRETAKVPPRCVPAT